jgi:hypothetical protein
MAWRQQSLAIALEGRDHINGLARDAAVSRLDGAAVDHERRPVQACHGDDDTRHVLVAARQRDIGIVPLQATQASEVLRSYIHTLQADVGISAELNDNCNAAS